VKVLFLPTICKTANKIFPTTIVPLLVFFTNKHQGSTIWIPALVSVLHQQVQPVINGMNTRN